MDCILLHLSYGSVCKVVPELFCWISADTSFRQRAALIISAFSTLELRCVISNNGFRLFFCRLLNSNSRFLFICAFSLNSCKIFFNCKLMLAFAHFQLIAGLHPQRVHAATYRCVKDDSPLLPMVSFWKLHCPLLRAALP